MLTFLFWNIGKKDLSESIGRVAEREKVDVLILAESRLRPDQLLPRLNRQDPGAFHFTQGRYLWIDIYTRFHRPGLQVVSNDNRHYLIGNITLPDGKTVLLAAAHLISQRTAKREERAKQAGRFASCIVQAEEKVGHDRTLVMGDLNANPFEDAAYGRDRLHALECRRVAEAPPKPTPDQNPTFYNPMWSRMGDATPGPPGTYFYEKGGGGGPYWNTLDQVLLRPSLLPHFSEEGLAVVETDGTDSLLDSDGRPDGRNASDHLPLRLSLDI